MPACALATPASADAGPEDSVGDALEPRRCGAVGDHVLVEAQVAAGTDDSAELVEGALLAGEGAQHTGRDTGIEGPLVGRQPTGHAVDHLHRGTVTQAQPSPLHASAPSLTAIAAISRPTTGSSHHAPNSALPRSPSSSAPARRA